MNKSILALLTVATALAATSTAVTPARAIEYPWCAVYSGGDDGGGGGNCGFVSWEQCMQTVRGIGGDCQPNPFYNPAVSPARKPQRKRPR